MDDGARIIRFDRAGYRLGSLVSVESLRDADMPTGRPSAASGLPSAVAVVGRKPPLE